MAEAKGISVPKEAVSLSSPTELVAFAKTLKQFIVNEQLFTAIKNKNYVNVEGWQFAGAVTGVFPIVDSLIRVEADEEIKYRAEVQLKHIATDAMVGYGVAICSNKELGRDKADEYVIASMAQTRATGKAYRNAFGWLMKVAGYEATPYEEVIGNPANLGPDTEEKIANAKTKEEFTEILKGLSVAEQKTAATLINKRLKELDNASDQSA